MTNFEKIKQMTVEEFAEKFGDSICSQISAADCTGDCDDCIVNWLNKEAEE